MSGDDFLFGLKFDFDNIQFLRGSERAQDELERLVASLSHARRRSQEEVEALAKSLSLTPEEVRKSLAEIDRAERQHEAEKERAERQKEQEAARREQAQKRQQAEQHRREMEYLRERTQAAASLRDALLSVAALSIGGHGISGIVGATTGTAQNGVNGANFAERTGTSQRRNMAEEEGAYLSGLSSREEARDSIGAYAGAENEYRRTGHSSLTDTLIKNGVQVGPQFFREGHEAALAEVVRQMRGLGFDRQRQADILEQAGFTSGGYTNLALHPEMMHRYNQMGARRTAGLSEQAGQDLEFQQSWNNMISIVERLRTDIGHDLEPWVKEFSDFAAQIDKLARDHPDVARDIVGAIAAVTALGAFISALMVAIAPILAVRSALTAFSALSGAGGAATATAEGGAAAAEAGASGGGAVASGAAGGLGTILRRMGPVGALLSLLIPTETVKKDVLPGPGYSPVHAPILSSEQNANRQKIIQAYRAAGYSDSAITGLIARTGLESKYDPMASGDHGSAYGINQWHADRQANYTRLFGHTMQSVTDREQALREQIQFSQWELNNTDGMNGGGSMGRMLRGAKSAGEAAEMVSRLYVRPGATDYAREVESVRTQALARQLLPVVNGGSTVSNDRSTSIRIDHVTVKSNDPQQFTRGLQSMAARRTAQMAQAGQT